MKSLIHASKDPAFSEREKEHYALARKICADGIVLLENNGILPLKPSWIGLYGAGARHTAFGGTGSGENNPRYCQDIEQCLLHAGYSITSQPWLNGYDFHYYYKEYDAYCASLSKALKKVPLMEHMDYAADHPFLLPAGRVLEKDEKIHCDTAFYILTRQAGEGADRKDIPGDYYITEDEKAVMRSVTERYKDTVLVLNTGSVIDLNFLDEIHFSAVILLMQGGMETGNALVDVISGKVNPSGRLTDTWAYSYSDYPCADTFSERNPEQYQEDYKEGIFTGYRWFDKKGIRPRYPFGYGLSYAEFYTSAESYEAHGTTITVNASVKNTANLAGREVVMLFVSFPEHRFIREKRALAAFAKTPVINPGDSANISLSFDLKDHAAFDIETGSFVLEKGCYTVALNDTPLFIAELDADAVTEKAGVLFKSDRKIESLITGKAEQEIPVLPHIRINASDIDTTVFSYGVPEMVRDDSIDEIVSKLSVKDMTKLLVGRTYFGPYRHRVFGAVGYTTSKLFGKGIDSMPMADGPQGLNLTKISKKPLHGLFAIPTMPESIRISHKIVRKELKEDTGKELYYQYCTSWPSETLVAQTWDIELARQMGDAIGKEMKEYGVVFWLGPAMNIHRNPLCGRNYEYYSEDPLLTGEMAAAVSIGVQSHEGCFVTLKHFAANNLETKRNVSSSNLDERTLREIYLKAFRIAVKKAAPEGVMCSYNKINGTYTALSCELQTSILRNEWGFDGIVMTDWFATGHHESLDELCCKAGTDLIMPGMPTIPSKIMKAYRKGLITKDDIERSARRIIRLALKSHLNRQD